MEKLMETPNIIKKLHIFLFWIYETLLSHLKIEEGYTNFNVFSFILDVTKFLSS